MALKKNDNFDSYNVFLSIAINIPQRLNTAFVLQGHKSSSALYIKFSIYVHIYIYIHTHIFCKTAMKLFFLSATQINMTSDNQIREESFVVLSVMNEILVHIKSRRLEPTAFLLDPSDRC